MKGIFLLILFLFLHIIYGYEVVQPYGRLLIETVSITSSSSSFTISFSQNGNSTFDVELYSIDSNQTPNFYRTDNLPQNFIGTLTKSSLITRDSFSTGNSVGITNGTLAKNGVNSKNFLIYVVNNNNIPINITSTVTGSNFGCVTNDCYVVSILKQISTIFNDVGINIVNETNSSPITNTVYNNTIIHEIVNTTREIIINTILNDTTIIQKLFNTIIINNTEIISQLIQGYNFTVNNITTIYYPNESEQLYRTLVIFSLSLSGFLLFTNIGLIVFYLKDRTRSKRVAPVETQTEIPPKQLSLKALFNHLH